MCGNLSTIVYTFMLLTAIPYLISALSCPLPTTAKTGNSTSAKLRIYDCYKFSSSWLPTCVKKKDVSLKQGLKTNLYNNKNSYLVMAKYFGKEVCVSYRKKEKKIDNKYCYKCEKECFDDEEEETYYSQPDGKRNILRSELTSVGADMKMKQIATTVVFSILELMYLLSS